MIGIISHNQIIATGMVSLVARTKVQVRGVLSPLLFPTRNWKGR